MSTDPSAVAPPGLAFTVEGRLARLTLNRPEKRNAMTEAMWRALPVVTAAAAADPAVAVLRVDGAGGHFCGGADIGEFPEVYGSAARIAGYNQAVKAGVGALAAFPRPAVAVIRGACVGGGMAIALACDIRLAARDARFAITPAKLGLVYSHGDTKRLVDAVGASRAKDMLFTGRVVDAEEALRIGLVDALADDVEALAAERIGLLLAASTGAQAGIKRMVGAIEAGAATETAALSALFAESFSSADFQEGYRAFLEKRPPTFR